MLSVTLATPTTRRTYDHRLREQVLRSGARTLARHVAIPRSTIATWRRRGLRPVVTIEPLDQDRQQLLDLVAKVDRRARILAAVVRLLMALLRASGFSLAGQRLPEGTAKAGILRAITGAEPFLPLALILRIVDFEPARYHAWRRAAVVRCLDDRSSCPRTSPSQLTVAEVANIKEMVLQPARGVGSGPDEGEGRTPCSEPSNVLRPLPRSASRPSRFADSPVIPALALLRTGKYGMSAHAARRKLHTRLPVRV